MILTVIGTGYVGLVTGACFADMGNDVICVDVDQRKIENLKKGIIPIYEPGLEELVKKNSQTGRLSFTTDIESAVKKSLFCFIAVGTPQGEDGSADLQYVLAVARGIGSAMSGYKIIVNKSTVPVGTAEKIREVVQAELDKRDVLYDFDVVSNQEFLKEGTALDDFFRPDRIIIGAGSERARTYMEELYAPFVRSGAPIISMNVRSSEMTKYAANALLATKISFMNEIANMCDAVGADVEDVRKGISADRRIGHHFLYPGIGYGGSCFPKDVQALVKSAHDHGATAHIIEAVEKVNHLQKEVLVQKILAHYHNTMKDKIFAVWGLAFKPNTDDMRAAPAVTIITKLLESGAKIQAYDPEASKEARRIFGEKITISATPYDALRGADALLLLTEWGIFREPDFTLMRSLMHTPVIFDGRNQYNPLRMQQLGFIYFCIGRPSQPPKEKKS